MNILLVDDDRFVITAMEQKIDWKSLGVQNVYTAYSMLQAQKVITTQKVDLLITDIEMPKGSGLDLLSWMRSENINTQTIFLTNHADFHYAQKALVLQSFDYCLKPLEFDKLTLIIHKAIEKIRTIQNAAPATCANLPQSMLSQKKKESFWQNIFAKKPEQPSPYAENQNFLLMEISLFPYYLDNDTIISKMDEITDFFNLFQNMFDKSFSSGDWNLETLVEYKFHRENLIAVFSINTSVLEKIPEAIFRICQRFILSFRNQFGIDICCFISNVFTLPDFSCVFSSIMEQKTNQINCRNKVFTCRDASPNNIPASEPPLSKMELALNAEKPKEFIVLYENYLDKLSSDFCLNHNTLYSFLLDVTQILYTFLKSREILAHKLFQNPTYEFLRTHCSDSLENTKLYLHFVTEKAFNYISFAASKSSVTEIMKEYIDANYHQEINRNDLSNVVYLHPDYAARIFKNEMNISVNNYIIQKRLQEAMKLLKQTQLPVNTVADKVGYANYSYFTKLFKKETGYTPQEYRKKNSQ